MMDLLNSLSFDSNRGDSASKEKANTAIASNNSTDYWIDETVDCIARMCNLCGEYEIQQVVYEFLSKEQRQQHGTNADLRTLEVELYRKFLFDEQSVSGRADP